MNESLCLTSPWPGPWWLSGRMNESLCLSSPWAGFNSQLWQSISRDFLWLITLCQPILSQRCRKWLNLPSMSPHNVRTARKKTEVQIWTDDGCKKRKKGPKILNPLAQFVAELNRIEDQCLCVVCISAISSKTLDAIACSGFSVWSVYYQFFCSSVQPRSAFLQTMYLGSSESEVDHVNKSLRLKVGMLVYTVSRLSKCQG